MDEKAIVARYKERWEPGPLEPVRPAEKLAASFREFEELKRLVLTPADTYRVGGEDLRIRKSGWRKLALAFDLTDEIVDEIQEKDPKDPNTWVWHVRVRVSARGGRTVEGVSSCSTRERKFSHPDHDTHALAHTRAKSRAIADMLGAGDLIAEELDEEPTARSEEMPRTKAPETAGRPAREAPAELTPQQKAREWLTSILGEDTMQHVAVRLEDGRMVAYLEARVPPPMCALFVDRLERWGYHVEATDVGLRVVLLPDRLPHTGGGEPEGLT